MRKLLNICFLALSPMFLQAQDEPKPYGALPSERQLKWHEMETYVLIHYTPTTFQNKEWGYGDADPKLFNPSHFDANQIAKAAASGNFKGLISVAKHHDGFCLWPTKTTSYSVASSPWENGKGDMVKDFMEASHQAGLKFGVYLSAWDRNDTRYGTAEYADAYRAQLTELMTQYGELFTSWHDGANGGDGYYGGLNEKRVVDRTTYYEWVERTWPIVRKLQPNAMIFSDVGPDMRWVGNEKGFAAETSWATITPKGLNGNAALPGVVDDSNLMTGNRNGEFWIPAECDVPQRPGWFYHPDQDSKVKTPDELFEIYLKSVGRGGGMNLGLAPMPQGILHQNDVKSLKAFGEKLTNTFSKNLIDGATLKASNTRNRDDKKFDVAHLLDDDRYSYWATDDDVKNSVVEITLPEKREFDLIRIRENIKLGQRIDSVQIEVNKNGNWEYLASATSIGASRIIKLNKPSSELSYRIKIFAPVAPALSEISFFKEYEKEFAFDAQESNQVDKSKFTIPELKSESKSVFDNNAKTFATVDLKNSKSITINLNSEQNISALSFTPRQDGSKAGTPTKYKVSGSRDGKKWNELASGEFSNIRANPTAQYISFGKSVEVKFLRFEVVETLENDSKFSVAEFDLFH
ncbi:alpha-L-fucosidase [Sphingobacterium hungaricum]